MKELDQLFNKPSSGIQTTNNLEDFEKLSI